MRIDDDFMRQFKRRAHREGASLAKLLDRHLRPRQGSRLRKDETLYGVSGMPELSWLVIALLEPLL